LLTWEKLGKALDLLKDMESTGCPQSTITYDTIIDGLCKTMRIEEAKEVFDQRGWILIARVDVHLFIACQLNGYEKFSKKLAR
jgi:pentatricopeptide repeat protein